MTVSYVGGVTDTAAGWALDTESSVVVLSVSCEAGCTVAVSTTSWTNLKNSAPDLRDKGSIVLDVEVGPVLADFCYVDDPIGAGDVAIREVVHRPGLLTFLEEENS